MRYSNKPTPLCSFKERPDAACRKPPRCRVCHRPLAFVWRDGLCPECAKPTAKAGTEVRNV